MMAMLAKMRIEDLANVRIQKVGGMSLEEGWRECQPATIVEEVDKGGERRREGGSRLEEDYMDRGR